MADTFETAIQKMVKEQGVMVFDNPVRFKKLLANYTGNGFIKESELLVRIVEEGCVKDIAAAAQIATTASMDVAKRKILRHLTEEAFLAEEPAMRMVNILGLILLEAERKNVRDLLFGMADEQGDVAAQYILGVSYLNGIGVPKDAGKAVEWFSKAAEQGLAWAQNDLARCYYNGNGMPRDVRKAVEWYHKAAEQEYAEAQFYLGVCYLCGSGVHEDGF